MSLWMYRTLRSEWVNPAIDPKPRTDWYSNAETSDLDSCVQNHINSQIRYSGTCYCAYAGCVSVRT